MKKLITQSIISGMTVAAVFVADFLKVLHYYRDDFLFLSVRSPDAARAESHILAMLWSTEAAAFAVLTISIAFLAADFAGKRSFNRAGAIVLIATVVAMLLAVHELVLPQLRIGLGWIKISLLVIACIAAAIAVSPSAALAAASAASVHAYSAIGPHIRLGFSHGIGAGPFFPVVVVAAILLASALARAFSKRNQAPIAKVAPVLVVQFLGATAIMFLVFALTA